MKPFFLLLILFGQLNILSGINNDAISAPDDENNLKQLNSTANINSTIGEIYRKALFDGLAIMPRHQHAKASVCLSIAFFLDDLYGANHEITECRDVYMPLLEKFAKLLEDQNIKAAFEPYIQHDIIIYNCAFYILDKMMPDDYTSPFVIAKNDFDVNMLLESTIADFTPAMARYIYWDRYNFDCKLNALKAIVEENHEEYQKITAKIAIDYFKFAAQLQLIFDPEYKLFNGEYELNGLEWIRQNDMMQEEINANPIVKSWLEEWQKRINALKE